MNDRAGVGIDDDQVIARLRGALDEVTSAAGNDEIPLRIAPNGRRRLMVVAGSAAACVALLAVAVWAVTRRSPEPVAGEPEPTSLTVAATSPSTTAPPATTAPEELSMRFRLISPDLVPDAPSRPTVVLPFWSAVWQRTGDAGGLLMLAVTDQPVVDSSTATVRNDITPAGQTMYVWSAGLTLDEQELAAAAIVPGSGLPFVLPDDGWNLLAGNSGTQVVSQQQYSSQQRSVVLTEGPYAGQFDAFAGATATSVTVAGHAGWKAVFADGGAEVIWKVDDLWVSMRITAELADRVDGLIAAVTDLSTAQPAIPVSAPDAITTDP
jgi:hypothetical protein